jgi:uncharacterized protein (TIGR03435 family)
MLARSGSVALLAAGLLAQSTPHFEVASVKPSVAPVGSPAQVVFSAGRVMLENHTLAMLIARAWNKEATGLPAWALRSTFTVSAKSGFPAGPNEMQPMLQNLLQERFRMKFHRETRQMDIFVLSRSGNTRPHAAPHQTCAPSGSGPGIPECGRLRLSLSRQGEGEIRGGQVSVQGLVAFLESFWHRKVVDRSEMTGAFDVDLKFEMDMDQPGSPDLSTPASSGGGPPPPPGPPSFHSIPPGLNRSLNEQLGLTLKTSKGPVEVFVVDRVERPTPN